MIKNKIQPNKFLNDIALYKAGKSTLTNPNLKVIKLSSNENSLGTSPLAIEKIKSIVAIERYPNSNSDDLRKKISEKFELEFDNVICTAGSDEIISMICNAFVSLGDEVIYSEYGFLMYSISTIKSGGVPIKAKEVDYKTTPENILSLITDKTKVIFIANPNNPTGTYLTKNELENFIKLVPQNIVIVIDMAYAEYVAKANYDSSFDLAKKYDNVIITRTFSKIYGLASMRVGYGYTNSYISEILNKVKPPFNVNLFGQIAAEYALEDDEFILKSKKHNQFWNEKITFKLRNKDYNVIDSVGNFVLLELKSKNETNIVNENLLRNGIIVRNVSEYGLERHLRISIGTEEENLKLLSVLLLNKS